MTKKRNTADISSVDLAQGLVILMSGEEVPITNIYPNAVVVGPTADNQWLAVELDDDEKETTR